MKSGIYAICCRRSGYRYIGSAQDLEARERHHRRRYRDGLGHNAVLQFAWNVFGGENFTWEVLEHCTRDQLAEREQHYLTTARGPLFNILRDPRRPPPASRATRKKLSQKAREQHASGRLGRQTWRSRGR